MIDHDEIEERIIRFVLDAMDDAELTAFESDFESHVRTCDRCRTLYADFVDVAGRLALATPPVDPPPGLEDRIVAAATGRARLAEAPSRRGRAGRLVLGIAAAVVLVAGSVGGTWAYLRPSGGPLRSVSLVMPGGGRLDLVYNDRVAGVVGHDVAAAPAGKDYQLWLGTESHVTSAGTFEAASGEVSAPAVLSDPGFTVVAVSVEPDGGSAQPTSDPIASATR